MTAKSALDPTTLHCEPNALWPHYSRFRVAERLLLTGHSHQAWPDVAWQGVQEALDDAARFVDDKWPRAFERAEAIRKGYAARLEDTSGSYALGQSVHELLVRWLSALPFDERPQIVTTDGEFHSVRRQLERLAEAGVELVRVPAEPAATVGARLAERVSDRTACAIVSAVFFENAHLTGGLAELAARCEHTGALLLIDVYHALNVVPFTIEAHRLEHAYLIGGGYKYMQLGEGCAFLRLPADCRLRPLVTGWFAEFETLATEHAGYTVRYPNGPGRFAGATYDPISHYRGARVLRFQDEHGLRPALLREISLHQIAVLEEAFDALDLDPRVIERPRTVARRARGGFLALRTPHAARLVQALRERGVFCDHRGPWLRLGPAPYLSDRQLQDAVRALGEAARAVCES